MSQNLLALVSVQATLLSMGWISAIDYVNRLADALGVESAFKPSRHSAQTKTSPPLRLIDATTASPSQIARDVNTALKHGSTIQLYSSLRPDLIDHPDDDQPDRQSRVRRATHALRKARPKLSAATSLPLWLITIVISCLGLFVGATLIDPPLAYFIIACVAAIPFAFIVCLRILVLITHICFLRPKLRPRQPEPAMADLPTYSILVPLYDEAEILPDLVDALILIDYPAAKLDVILILEEDDTKTQTAADASGLPGFIRVVRVPNSGPRTKPKALNYALDHARRDYITIFDAEDIPEPQQLRKALAIFASHPDVVCLQAQLNIYNRNDSWLARQFALECTTLFDGMLPALEHLNVPFPLGGTSNHFRRYALEQAGAWDPFNVTEDADLGIRLSRNGSRIGLLKSTTWEEAPSSLASWIPQRTRWLKGWMQTYMVHMRRPFQLWAELGTWRFVGFQCLIFGLFLSALLHPFLYVVIAIELTSPTPFANSSTTLEITLWW